MTPMKYGKPYDPKAKKSYCYGDPRFAFQQGEQVYNANFEPVDADGKVMPLPPVVAAKPPEPVSPEPPQPIENPEDDIPEDEKPFDLLGWAQGAPELQAAPWAKVKAETARLIEDMTLITGKAAAKKAILSHYNIAE